jgi:hypothetical protein
MIKALLILKALFKALSATTKTLNKSPSTRYVKPSETNLTPQHHWPPPKNYEFECSVIGESYYQHHLIQLAGEHGKQSACVDVVALLLPEPTNQYDKNAVRILIQGETVGFIPKEHCKTYLRRLTALKLSRTSPTTCDAQIMGGFIGKDGKRTSYGVVLNIKPFDD